MYYFLISLVTYLGSQKSLSPPGSVDWLEKFVDATAVLCATWRDDKFDTPVTWRFFLPAPLLKKKGRLYFRNEFQGVFFWTNLYWKKHCFEKWWLLLNMLTWYIYMKTFVGRLTPSEVQSIYPAILFQHVYIRFYLTWWNMIWIRAPHPECHSPPGVRL